MSSCATTADARPTLHTPAQQEEVKKRGDALRSPFQLRGGSGGGGKKERRKKLRYAGQKDKELGEATVEYVGAMREEIQQVETEEDFVDVKRSRMIDDASEDRELKRIIDMVTTTPQRRR